MLVRFPTTGRVSAGAIRRAAASPWRIAAAGAAGLAMTAPGQTVGVSVFVDPMIDALAISRSQLSMAYLVGTLLGAATLPSVGHWLDRAGVRRVMTFVGAGFGAALAAMAGVTGLLTLVVGFTGIRMLGQGSLSLVSTTSVAVWFDRRRGIALGIVTAVGSAAMSLAPLALNGVIGQVGWRVAWLLTGAAVWAIVLPLARLGMRDAPRDLAAVAPQEVRPPPGRAQRHVGGGVGWTRAEASRTGMFWALTLGVSAVGMIGTGLAFHQISLLGERGLTPVQAAANFLPQTAAAIAATLLTGWLVDRIRPRVLVVASMTGLAAAMVLAQVAAPGWLAVLFGVTVGASGGAVRALEAASLPRFFGTAHVGSIRGLVMALNVASTALGPYVLAVGFERAGSYGPVLTMLLAVPLAVAALAVFAPVPDAALRRRIRARAGDAPRLPLPYASTMPLVSCPACGETDDLSGARRDDGALEIACQRCGARWERDPERRCGLCGSSDLRYTPKALWERGRGEQRTPAGEIPAYACWSCGGRDVTSSRPVPGASP